MSVSECRCISLSIRLPLFNGVQPQALSATYRHDSKKAFPRRCSVAANVSGCAAMQLQLGRMLWLQLGRMLWLQLGRIVDPELVLWACLV
jgi:hypothetical protein